jgi:hypothetical protein
MGISGIKCEQTIKLYSSKIRDQMKRQMSDILRDNLPQQSVDVEMVTIL